MKYMNIKKVALLDFLVGPNRYPYNPLGNSAANGVLVGPGGPTGVYGRPPNYAGQNNFGGPVVQAHLVVCIIIIIILVGHLMDHFHQTEEEEDFHQTEEDFHWTEEDFHWTDPLDQMGHSHQLHSIVNLVRAY